MNTELKILLVEDNEDHAMLIKSALSNAGQVVHMASAELAKLLLKDSTTSVNLMLLDIKLPDCSGVELLRWVKADAELSLLPVIMLTTSANPKDIADCYGAGASGFITKPVGFSALKEKMDVFVKYWQQVSVSPLA